MLFKVVYQIPFNFYSGKKCPGGLDVTMIHYLEGASANTAADIRAKRVEEADKLEESPGEPREMFDTYCLGVMLRSNQTTVKHQKAKEASTATLASRIKKKHLGLVDFSISLNVSPRWRVEVAVPTFQEPLKKTPQKKEKEKIRNSWVLARRIEVYNGESW